MLSAHQIYMDSKENENFELSSCDKPKRLDFQNSTDINYEMSSSKSPEKFQRTPVKSLEKDDLGNKQQVSNNCHPFIDEICPEIENLYICKEPNGSCDKPKGLDLQNSTDINYETSSSKSPEKFQKTPVKSFEKDDLDNKQQVSNMCSPSIEDEEWPEIENMYICTEPNVCKQDRGVFSDEDRKAIFQAICFPDIFGGGRKFESTEDLSPSDNLEDINFSMDWEWFPPSPVIKRDYSVRLAAFTD